MNKEAVIQCQNVGKTYDDGSLKVEVLRNIDFQVASGEGIGIIGASGSGKFHPAAHSRRAGQAHQRRSENPRPGPKQPFPSSHRPAA